MCRTLTGLSRLSKKSRDARGWNIPAAGTLAAQSPPWPAASEIVMSEDRVAPGTLKYDPEHTWLKFEPDGTGRVGVTYFAQKQLKDVVFVELPALGVEVAFMEPFGVIESAKATNDLYSPASGRVMARNEALSDDPGLINRDPYGEGWMITIALSRPDEVNKLISADEYRALIGGKG